MRSADLVARVSAWLNIGGANADMYESSTFVSAQRHCTPTFLCPVTTKRTILLPILTATIALASGCGGSGSSNSASIKSGSASQASQRVVATPAQRSPVGTHAQYAAFANAVNLRTRDLPGFTASPEKQHKSHKAKGESEFQSCLPGYKETQHAFESKSDKFKAGGGLKTTAVSSNVQIAPTVAKAQASLAAVKKASQNAAIRECMIHAFDHELGAQSHVTHVGSQTVHITLGGVKLAPIDLGSIAGLPADASAGLSVSINVVYSTSVEGHSIRIPASFELDVLGFAVGRAEVTLSTEGFGEPFPSAVESRLFSLLASRAVTAAHGYPAVEQ
jgi:hypothetical protein